MSALSKPFSFAALFALPVFGNYILFDTIAWDSIKPDHGATGQCICIKGMKENEQLDAYCTLGLNFGRNQKNLPDFDGLYPIDISTDGGDGAWIDKMIVNTMSGGNRRYGINNAHGWCLSQDRDDSRYFGRYATTNGKCYTTLSLRPNRKVYGYYSEKGYWKSQSLYNKSKYLCGALRRRAEKDEGEFTVEDGFAEDAGFGSGDALDWDPESDARVLGELRQTVQAMVRENADVTFGRIYELFKIAERIVRDEDEEEAVIEPEASDGDQPQEGLSGSAEVGSSFNGVPGRLQELEGSP